MFEPLGGFAHALVAPKRQTQTGLEIVRFAAYKVCSLRALKIVRFAQGPGSGVKAIAAASASLASEVFSFLRAGSGRVPWDGASPRQPGDTIPFQ